MVNAYRPDFYRNFIPNGSFDSVCLLCYQALAKATIVTELSQHERNHRCDPVVLYLMAEGRVSILSGLVKWT
jgi:hypothetical protein